MHSTDSQGCTTFGDPQSYIQSANSRWYSERWSTILISLGTETIKVIFSLSITNGSPLFTLSMKLFAITASHISSVDRWVKGLIPVLESIDSQDEISGHYLSLSRDECITKDMISQLSRFKKTTVTVQDEKLYQFDHLAKIIYRYDFSPDDRLMIVDDDDLVLSLPNWKEHRVIQGIQYVPKDGLDADFVEGITITNFHNIKDQCRVVDDLSGYIAPFSIVWIYFENRGSISSRKSKSITLSHIEDTQYMDFLDSKIPHKPIPFIFHKLWGDLSTWVKEANPLSYMKEQ